MSSKKPIDYVEKFLFTMCRYLFQMVKMQIFKAQLNRAGRHYK